MAYRLPEELQAAGNLLDLNSHIVECFRCPRLVAHREQTGAVGRKAFRGQTYWSRPVPGFGDPQARLLVIGLAPAAHGGNRTGRIFTGDRSGDYLFRAMHRAGFSNQPTSIGRSDRLALIDAYITAAVRCAPPDNKPAPDEFKACRPYLQAELRLLTRLRVIVALGSIAFESYLRCLQEQGKLGSRSPFKFRHGGEYRPDNDGPLVLASYHPSQQNTSTKRLTDEMLADIFLRAAHSILH